MLYCSVNGKVTDQLVVGERGLSFGDGVFTTAKIVKGKIDYLSFHLARLQQAVNRLEIDYHQFDSLRAELKDIAQSFEQAVLKVIITAGNGGRGYARGELLSPTIVITVSDYPQQYLELQTTGINLVRADTQLGKNPLLAGVKHLNRLEQVLIKRELDKRCAFDAIVTDIDDYMVETSCANLFWIESGQLYTPSLSHAGVDGIIRQRVLANFNQTIITQATFSQLANVQAVFICNSLMGIVAVNQIESLSFNSAAVKPFQQFLLEDTVKHTYG